MLPVSPGTATLTQGRHDVRARIMEQLDDDVCVCVCLSGERGRKGKEERGVCLGVHAVELCVCVCSRFACMKSDS